MEGVAEAPIFIDNPTHSDAIRYRYHQTGSQGVRGSNPLSSTDEPPIRGGFVPFSEVAAHRNYWSFARRNGVTHQPLAAEGVIRDKSAHPSVGIKRAEQADEERR